MFSEKRGVVTNSAVDTGLQTLHSTINSSKNAVYIAYKSSDALEIVKQSLDDFWLSGDH